VVPLVRRILSESEFSGGGLLADCGGMGWETLQDLLTRLVAMQVLVRTKRPGADGPG
jgi:hypothetical protein